MNRIRVIGLIIVLLAVLGAYVFFLGPGARERPDDIQVFLAIVTLFYIVAGLGALFPSRPGYFAFKAFLYLCVVAFPIGTVVALTTLSYMRRHNLKREFGFRA